MEIELIRGERRARRRYDLELELRFQYSKANGETCVGRGRTADIGQGGIRFWTDTPPPVGSFAELNIKWPFLLQDVCQLELVAQGVILRSDDRGASLLLVNYEFRTCGERSFSPEREPQTGCAISA